MLHLGWSLHAKPLAVPPQVPVRYLGWRAGSKQVELIHGAGWGTTCLGVVLAARASSTTLGRHPARRRAAHACPHDKGGWRGQTYWLLPHCVLEHVVHTVSVEPPHPPALYTPASQVRHVSQAPLALRNWLPLQAAWEKGQSAKTG